MAPDFTGYATKAGLKCSDGRTIQAHAFKHQDGDKVPLVWGHIHDDPENVLGHAILENCEDGVRVKAYFNDTPKAQATKTLVQHGDVDSLSIWANKLVEKSKTVLHGMIKEVSVVLSGANPGAKIDYVGVRHSDGSVDITDEEAIISTGLPLEFDVENEELAHAEDDEKDASEVFETLNDEQKDLFYAAVGAALEAANAEKGEDVKHSDEEEAEDNSEEDEREEESEDNSEEADESTNNDEDNIQHQEGTTDMAHNVFEQNDTKKKDVHLSHDDLETIVTRAKNGNGSLKDAFVDFIAHETEYGIEDIEFLFPDAKNVTSQPETISRQMEWVQDVLDATKHSPISRIKSTAADLTADEARAKGYVKGAKKKEEIIKLLKRVTTPTTVYKKQKLDRDDIVDITDLDVVAWLKWEMKLMLNEEVARAILIGDGREPDDEDKIDEEKLRPIAYDDDMYAHKVTLASNVAPKDIVEAILRARVYYRGTGTPTLYTTDEILTDLMLQEDKMGRRLYATETELAAALRVRKIVVVEPMQDNDDLLAVIVNLFDYTVGADKGGQLSMFDDFDIDYNQYKYLLETRISGALTKPKSAVVIKKTVGTTVTPTQPSFDSETNTITIPSVTGVTYRIDGSPVTGSVVITENTEVEATANSGYSFPHNTDADWFYTFNEDAA